MVDEMNPYTFEQRDMMLQSLYPDSSLMIDYIYDTPTDKQWIENINDQIFRLGMFESVTFYCGDTKNDSAIQAIKKYQKILDVEEIIFREIDRSQVTISHNDEQILVSATRVREALINKDNELVQKMLPEEVCNLIS